MAISLTRLAYLSFVLVICVLLSNEVSVLCGETSACFVQMKTLLMNPRTWIKRNVLHKIYEPPKHYGLSMKTKIGIIGLPNVGKSTLFNALARQALATAANFPFCTIEPNIVQVPIPDKHLQGLGELANSERMVPATLEFVDIAGLVKGASKGEGLGNKFLGTIRECSAVIHVVRCFEDPNIVHVDGRINPIEDIEVVNVELILADLAHIERRLERSNCVEEERETLESLRSWLYKGFPARTMELSESAQIAIRSMGLLTLKPVIYACNVAETDFASGGTPASRKVQKTYGDHSSDVQSKASAILVSAQLESELWELQEEDRIEFLSELGITLPLSDDNTDNNNILHDQYMSSNTLPLEVCNILGVQRAYTGPGVDPTRSKTTRAHLVRPGLTAHEFAGRIHGDIQRGFIRAEVINGSVLKSQCSYKNAKESGLIRSEGKGYEIQNEDVILIKWH
mmetsp:Transcript_30014/g.38534  ORF Transcript_30014/g.38534 Transcript_30014/m.38534 type:complete len:455 (-) Transcript_30014:221-1585(-)